MAHQPLRFLSSLVAPQEARSGPFERRATPRRSANLGVLYTNLTGGSMQTADGAVLDVSEKGIGICGGMPVNVGDSLLVVLFSRDGESTPVFHLEANVVWSQGQRFGVRIVHLRESERQLLHELLQGEGRQVGRYM